jgi:cobalt-zinc-cadmium efflux system membrane fusion protein
MHLTFRSGLCAGLLLLGACSRTPESAEHHPAAAEHAEKPGKAESPAKSENAGKAGAQEHAEQEHEEKSDLIALSEQQIAAAHIELIPVRRDFAGAIDAPAMIVADPRHTAVVGVAVAGRIVELRRNVGEAVARDDVLAVIESQDAAQMKAELALARKQLELAQTTLRREERLYQEKVSAQQDVLAARGAEQEAKIRADLAHQRLAAAGGSADGAMNRLAIRAPIKGHIVARKAALGDSVQPNADLFQIADLSDVSVELSLSQDDAARVAVGSPVVVTGSGRAGAGRIAFLSRVVDPATRQVSALASLPNAKGTWRVGETVRASIPLSGAAGGQHLAIPRTAVQTVEDKPSVFVRVKEGFAVKHVVLGTASAGYVTVLSGLSGDERIAVSNSYVLKAELGKGEGGDHDD